DLGWPGPDQTEVDSLKSASTDAVADKARAEALEAEITPLQHALAAAAEVKARHDALEVEVTALRLEAQRWRVLEAERLTFAERLQAEIDALALADAVGEKARSNALEAEVTALR